MYKDGWSDRFSNSSDPMTEKVLKDMELLPDIESGLRNITRAFFWPYAYLGSQYQLDYIVRTNFSTTNKRAVFHISKECFVPSGISLIFPKKSIYSTIIAIGLDKVIESGFLIKIKNDVEWQMMRSATGKLLAANVVKNKLKALSVDDRALTLDDTQGMFLLLAAGFLMGAASLLSEWFGGCVHLFKGRRRANSSSSIDSNPRSYGAPTPRQKLDSVQYNSASSFAQHVGEADDEFNKRKCLNKVDIAVEINSSTSVEDLEKHINRLFDFDNHVTSTDDKDEENLKKDN